MLVANHPQRELLDQQPATGAVVQALADPLVAIGVLLVCVAQFHMTFGGAYLILALIVFSLTFPGKPPPSSTVGGVIGGVLISWLAIVALLLVLGWATQTLGFFDQRVILAWVVATPMAMIAAHLIAPVVLPRVLALEGMQRVAVIIGAGEVGRNLAARIQAAPSLGMRFAGYFDDRCPDRLGGGSSGKMLGSLGELAEYAKSGRVDLIYITLPMASQPRILALLDQLKDTTASIYFAPDIFLFDLIQGRMDRIGGFPVVAVCETPFCGVNGLVKRASDIVLATSILALILPVMIAIAIGVKASSPGPVLFKQRRYGLDGREIFIYKFRSMTVTEDGDSIRQATRGDPRVTRFGGFLRRTSLDELPQFINVLQGRMSVVGPRPHAVAHNEMYRKLIKGYMIRHKVRPGITGWAQVNGLRGETETLEKMKARIEYDLAYLRNWSLALDLKIVLKTIFVLGKPNAY